MDKKADFGQNQLMKKIILLVIFLCSASTFATSFDETVKFGAYSGRPGYYVKIGLEENVLLNAVLMNEQVYKKAVQILSKVKLGETKNCTMVGTQQDVGSKEAVYLIYSIKSCK